MVGLPVFCYFFSKSIFHFEVYAKDFMLSFRKHSELSFDTLLLACLKSENKATGESQLKTTSIFAVIAQH